MQADLDRIVAVARYRQPVERTTLRVGISEIEVLEPKGAGAVADFLGRRGPGLFAVGFASADPGKFRVHLQTQAVSFNLGVHSSRRSKVRQTTPGFIRAAIRLGEGLTSHLAILAPWGNATPIGRFFYGYGSGIYVASAMSEKLAAIRQRLGFNAHAAPTRSADGPLLIPSRPLGGARLAVFARAAGASGWDVSSPLFDAQRAWA